MIIFEARCLSGTADYLKVVSAQEQQDDFTKFLAYREGSDAKQVCVFLGPVAVRTLRKALQRREAELVESGRLEATHEQP